jgi:predicted nucleic acid-binding protein
LVLLYSAGDYVLAREYLARPETRLRAGDALHLAIAKNQRVTAIYSLDKKLLSAGATLGVPARAAIWPERLSVEDSLSSIF